MKKLNDTGTLELSNIFQTFCLNNGIKYPEINEDDFYKTMRLNWPTVTMELLKDALRFFMISDQVKRPYTFNLRFFGELITAYRNSSAAKDAATTTRFDHSINAEKKYTPEQREETIKKTFPIVYNEWNQMRNGNGCMPIKILLEHYDELMIDAEVYTVDTFNEGQRLEAFRAWINNESQQSQSFARKVVNKIHKGAKQTEADKHAIGRIGCYFDAVTAQRLQPVPPQKIVELLKSKPNAYL